MTISDRIELENSLIDQRNKRDAFKERLRQLAEKWEKEAKELVVDYNDVGLARILALEQCVRQLRELLDKP